jgi:hypothetical protein
MILKGLIAGLTGNEFVRKSRQPKGCLSVLNSGDPGHNNTILAQHSRN